MIFEGNAKECMGLADSLDGAILDCLPLEIMVIDSNGVVFAANARWKESAAPIVAGARRIGLGENLLEAVEACAVTGNAFAQDLLEGLKALIGGDSTEFTFAGPVDAGETEWFSLSARRTPGQRGATVISRFPAGRGTQAHERAAESGRPATGASPREETQALLVTLGDVLGRLTDAAEIQKATCGLLGEHLAADRVFYADTCPERALAAAGQDYFRDGLSTMQGCRWAAEDGGAIETLMSGRAVVVNDVAATADADRSACAVFGIGALAAVPLVMGNELHAALIVAASQPRVWSSNEIDLIRSVVERAWYAVKRALAEAALRESEQREKRRSAELQALLDTAPIGLSLALGAHGERIRGNRAVEEMLGVPSGGELSKAAQNPASFRAFHEGRELATGELPMQRAVRGEAVGGQTLDILREDGRQVTVFAKAMPLYDDAGNPRGAVGAFMDITKIKRAETALRENEERFRSLVESYAQAVWETDADGLVVKDSPSWRAYTGQTLEEWLGEGWLDAVHPDDRPHAMRQWREAVETRQKFDVEYRLRRCDQGWRWTGVRATPVLRRDGSVRKWIGMNIDIEARKQAEVALRESESRYRLLFEKMDEGFCIVEMIFEDGRAVDYRFLEANPAFESQSGLSNVIGRRMLDIEPALEARWFETYGRVAQTGEPVRFDDYSEAMSRYFDVYAFRVGAPENNKVAILFTDVTHRKAAEAALREGKERQAFLVNLIDGLRQIDDPAEIQATACRLLCEHLDVGRVSFTDAAGRGVVACRKGVDAAPSTSREPAGDLEQALTAVPGISGVVVIRNVFAEEAFSPAQLDRFKEAGIAAAASVTVLAGGRQVATLSAYSATPRAWTATEIDFIRDVAERVWSSTERARAIAALHESEFRLQLAMLSGDIGIYEWRIETNEMIWDDQLRAQWGAPDGTTTDFDAFMEGIHPADRPRVQEAVDQALDLRRGRLSVEFRLTASARPERWIAATGTMFFQEGRAVRMVGTARDITKRKRAEAERQKFVSLAEQSLEFIGICNMEFEPIYVNKAGIRLVGMKSFEDAQRVKVEDYFFPEDRDFINEEFFPRVFREGHANVEIRFRRFDTGEALWMLYNVFFLRDPDGEPIGLATVSRDITERRRAEDALKAADRRKDEFLATLAHELRNPLAPIRNAVHVLRHVHGSEDSPKDKRDLTVLSMIDRQVDHLIRLVDDLLEVSRITRGKIELKKQRVNLSDVLRHAVEMAQPTIDRGGHQLQVELPSEPLECEADPVRLEQVFANLLNNAAKYTEPGGRITLIARRSGDEAVAEVRDTGLGIPVEMLPRVFDLFTQVDRTLGRAQGGLGIGLALVKNLLEMQGGSVEAQSEGLGRGSAFIVRLPLLPPNTMEEPMTAATPTELDAARKVLVIDDDHDVADSLVMFLETFGASVQVAYGGAEGLEAIKSFRPELIFLDLGMPGMDGYETARRIRAAPEGRDVKLIALTGWGQDQIRDRARAAGFDLELTKPAGLEALQGLLASV